MIRRIAKSFLVTTFAVAPAACHSSSVDSIHRNPPALPPVPEPSATAPDSPAPRATVKRVRTKDGGAERRPAGAVDYASLKALNPTDAEGRTIFAAFDDTCYVETPMSEAEAAKLRNGPTGMRAVNLITVDCPPAMNDPAWDDCGGSTLSRTAKGDCVCLPQSGNPPPPPTANACPKK